MGRVHLEACAGWARWKWSHCQRRADEAAFRNVLANPAVDAVHICTPNAVHFRWRRPRSRPASTCSARSLWRFRARRRPRWSIWRAPRDLRNCTCHNLRYYPMVQQMRRMREAGDLGEILVVQGTYSQDWLLYDTDWNWRIDAQEGGPSRAMADIGSHWCDMAEHVTGLRITSLCADLQTFHKTRKQPKAFRSKPSRARRSAPEDYDETPIDTEDFGAVMFPHGRSARAERSPPARFRRAARTA